MKYVIEYTLEEYEDVKKRAYLRGLDAARDAVAEVEHIGYYAEEVRDAALAAIDGLRGES